MSSLFSAAKVDSARALSQQTPVRGRPDSDCWDVKLRFFDPDNTRRARKVYRFTIDLSDLVPLTLGEVRTWSER